MNTCSRLLDRKGDALAETVDRIDKPGLMSGRQGLLRNELHIAGAVVAIVRRKGMGAKKGRRDLDRQALAEFARHLQHLQLGLDIEPVARLDLDRRDALGQEIFEPPRGRGEKLLLARRARRLDRRQDAAARLGDLGIGDAVEPHLEFSRPIAAIDEMGVAIDEAGGEQSAAAIDLLARRRVAGAARSRRSGRI